MLMQVFFILLPRRCHQTPFFVLDSHVLVCRILIQHAINFLLLGIVGDPHMPLLIVFPTQNSAIAVDYLLLRLSSSISSKSIDPSPSLSNFFKHRPSDPFAKSHKPKLS